MTGDTIRRALIVAVPSVLLAYGVIGWLRGWPLGVDSSVYRAGAVLFAHGRSPYQAAGLGYLRLSFTYPPAAALLFAPLALLPAQLVWAVMASASVLGLALVIRVAIARAPYWGYPAGWSTPLLTVAMMCLLPVWRAIGLGQVTIPLMAMVTVDVLVVTARRPARGGLLTGVAAAVFLVPLIFIPHLFLTGNRTAARRALTVFAGLQGLALAIAPRDIAYWTSLVFQTDRIGQAQLPDNQSLNGVVARLTDMSPWSAYVAWAAGAALAVPALLLMRRYQRRGQHLSALCVTACYGLLLAPVSWRPTWVWMVPVVVVLMSWSQHYDGWRRWAGTGAVIAVFTSTYSVSASQQRHPTMGGFWFVVLGDSYVLTTVAIALVLTCGNE